MTISSSLKSEYPINRGSRSRNNFGIRKPEVQTSSALPLDYWFMQRDSDRAEESLLNSDMGWNCRGLLQVYGRQGPAGAVVRNIRSRARSCQQHAKKHLSRDSTWTNWASDVSRAGNQYWKHELRNISAVEHLSRSLVLSDGYHASNCLAFIWIWAWTNAKNTRLLWFGCAKSR